MNRFVSGLYRKNFVGSSHGELMMRCVIPSAISAPFPNSVSARRPFANMKPDLSLWRSWRKHQLADGIEDNLELSVIFLFQCSKLAGEFCIREEHLTQAHEGTHDGDVDLHGTRTPQNAGEHCDTLLGEGHGVAPPNFPRVGITVCDTRFLISATVSSNMKSAGKRSRFLRPACFNARVSTP